PSSSSRTNRRSPRSRIAPSTFATAWSRTTCDVRRSRSSRESSIDRLRAKLTVFPLQVPREACSHLGDFLVASREIAPFLARDAPANVGRRQMPAHFLRLAARAEYQMREVTVGLQAM